MNMIEYIQNDNSFYVSDEVSSVPTDESNTSWENRYKFVADLVSISRGRHNDSPEARFQQILKEEIEVSGNKNHLFAGKPLEFLPVVLPIDLQFSGDHLLRLNNDEIPTNNANFFRHCYIKDDEGEVASTYPYNLKVYTNFRHVYNWLVGHLGFTPERALETIPFNTREELKDFRAIRVSSPIFVQSQLMTHTQISKELQSDNMSADNGYWLPEDILDRIRDSEISGLKMFTSNLGKDNESIARLLIRRTFVNVLPQSKVQELLKQIGYEREIYSKAPYCFQYKEMVMAGWMNDPEVWEHFLLERGTYPVWIQKETEDVARAIKKILLKGV